jgi:hypothetical protein
MKQASMQRRKLLLVSFAPWALLTTSCAPDTTAADDQAIRQVLMAQFDKPEAPLAVAPVVVQGAHALAGWTQGERGGRALLRREGSLWRVVVCGGDGLKDAAALRDTGLSGDEAAALAKALANAEAPLPAAQRAKFAMFGATVRVEASGHPAPAHHDSGASASVAK